MGDYTVETLKMYNDFHQNPTNSGRVNGSTVRISFVIAMTGEVGHWFKKGMIMDGAKKLIQYPCALYHHRVFRVTYDFQH